MLLKSNVDNFTVIGSGRRVLFIKVIMFCPAHSLHPDHLHLTAASLLQLIHQIGFLWNQSENTETIVNIKKFFYVHLLTDCVTATQY